MSYKNYICLNLHYNLQYMLLLDFYCYIILYLSRIFKIFRVLYLFFPEILSELSASKFAPLALPQNFSRFFTLSRSRIFGTYFPQVFYRLHTIGLHIFSHFRPVFICFFRRKKSILVLFLISFFFIDFSDLTPEII